MRRSLVMLSLGLTSALIVSCCTSVGLASEVEESNDQSIQLVAVQESIEIPPTLEGVGQISVKSSLLIDGQQNFLYATFDNREQARNDIKEKIPGLMNELKEKYRLGELSDSNWEEYREKMYQYMNDTFGSVEYNAHDVRILQCFFDIYENDQQNKDILELLPKTKGAAATENREEIVKLLPSSSPVAEKTESAKLQRPKTRDTVKGFDQYKGYLYAVKYAEKSNWLAYGSLSGDCANFTSQILLAGGVDMVISSSKYEGWWHRIYGTTNHLYSRSWTQASTFARYMGVGYKTPSIRDFSCNIVPGDFIAADWTADGDWDHMGFATTTGTENWYGGIYYKDFKVAQHTNNYHLWVSESGNGWESIGSDGGKYGRVRR